MADTESMHNYHLINYGAGLRDDAVVRLRPQLQRRLEVQAAHVLRQILGASQHLPEVDSSIDQIYSTFIQK